MDSLVMNLPKNQGRPDQTLKQFVVHPNVCAIGANSNYCSWRDSFHYYLYAECKKKLICILLIHNIDSLRKKKE